MTLLACPWRAERKETVRLPTECPVSKNSGGRLTVDRLVIFEYCLLAVAPILLVWEWTLRFVRKQYPFSLILATISCLWILLGLIWRSAIGPDYSNLHGYIALLNSAANLLCAVAAAAIRSQHSYRTVLAALSLTLVWTVTLLIMYAV